jgi:hypothetical protein
MRSRSSPRRLARRSSALDRIDEIVPPGTNFNSADSGWTPPAVADPALRRRFLEPRLAKAQGG